MYNASPFEPHTKVRYGICIHFATKRVCRICDLCRTPYKFEYAFFEQTNSKATIFDLMFEHTLLSGTKISEMLLITRCPELSRDFVITKTLFLGECRLLQTH